MEDPEFLVQLRQLLRVWWQVPGSLAVLRLLVPPFNDARLRRWQEDGPVGQSSDEDGGQRNQGTQSVDWVEQTAETTGGTKGSSW